MIKTHTDEILKEDEDNTIKKTFPLHFQIISELRTRHLGQVDPESPPTHTFLFYYSFCIIPFSDMYV